MGQPAGRNLNAEAADLLDRQLAAWEAARTRYAALAGVRTRTLEVGGLAYRVQFNPARIVSSGARVDAAAIRQRKCFLCAENRPGLQESLSWGGHYHLLVNPYPIFPRHFTVADVRHCPQRIAGRLADMLQLACALPDYTIFYNGPCCGASAPDHAHFQAGSKGFLPIERQWRGRAGAPVAVWGRAALWLLDDAPRNAWVIGSDCPEDAARLSEAFCRALPVEPGEEEPRLNLLAGYDAALARWTLFLFPRRRHRPSCYFAEGDARMLCSPASVDLGGVFVLPVEADFLRITANDVAQVLGEVCYSLAESRLLAQRINKQLLCLPTLTADNPAGGIR